MTKLTLRVIDAPKGRITIETDAMGGIYINGTRKNAIVYKAAGPYPAFVWGIAEIEHITGPRAQLGLTQAMLDALKAHTAEYDSEVAEVNRKIREHDNLFNEGGEGFNPHLREFNEIMAKWEAKK